jgi:hypothetical protein
VIIWALRFSSGRHSPPGATVSNRRLQILKLLESRFVRKTGTSTFMPPGGILTSPGYSGMAHHWSWLASWLDIPM